MSSGHISFAESAKEAPDSLRDATDMDALTRLGEELKTAQIPAEPLKGIRRAWAARAKELKA